MAKELDQNYVQKGSPEYYKMIEGIRDDLGKFDASVMDYLAEHKDWMKEHKEKQDTETKNMDSVNAIYSRMLLAEATRPLISGRDPDAVMQAVSMMAAGYLTNPEFRKQFNDAAMNVLGPWVNKKAANSGPDSAWQKWSNKIAMSQNDGRLPLCPRNAAMMKLVLDRKAYNEMRQDGGDPPSIVMEKYQKNLNSLLDMAEADGCSMDDICKEERILVGHMMNYDASVERNFAETAYGSVKKSKGVKQDDGSYIWQGEFDAEWHKGEFEPFDYMFTPRVPTTEHDRSRIIDATMDDAFKRCKSADDVMNMLDMMNEFYVPPEDSWMHGWQKRNKRDYALWQDDCKNMNDIEFLDKQIATSASAHMKDWCDLHPEQAERFSKMYEEHAEKWRAAENVFRRASRPEDTYQESTSRTVHHDGKAEEGDFSDGYGTTRPYVSPNRRNIPRPSCMEGKDGNTPQYGA